MNASVFPSPALVKLGHPLPEGEGYLARLRLRSSLLFGSQTTFSLRERVAEFYEGG